MGAEPDLGELLGDLVEGGEDEAVELQLDDGAVAAHCHPDRGADQPGLGQRRVHHPVGAKLVEQVLGDPEHPAQRTDVLAVAQHLVVGAHRIAQPRIDRLCDGQFHQMTLSKESLIAWSAYTRSKMSSNCGTPTRTTVWRTVVP